MWGFLRCSLQVRRCGMPPSVPTWTTLSPPALLLLKLAPWYQQTNPVSGG